VEVVAEGFRNAYDFDWNEAGDLFTYDSDCERDFFLPWYAPTRIYHIAPGGHHGWRLDGHTRSWPRPDYYADTVGILAPLGRGSPTGVLCYRHTQFPESFRNGLFVLDWTFGRIHFLAHQPVPDGSTYTGKPEVFLEPMGNQGFAPTDAVVAPDGSLLVSIGGRKTRGAVYRIQYGDPERQVAATNWMGLAPTEDVAVLDAPQPLEEWSRAIWVPLARKLGPDRIARAVAEPRLSVERRGRGMEILTELFGGLPPALAALTARSPEPSLRARTAWSLGRAPVDGDVPLLLALARDSSPYVRTHALEAIHGRVRNLDTNTLQDVLLSNLGFADRRVHQAAARLAALLPEPSFRALQAQQDKSGLPQGRLTVALAGLWRMGPGAPRTNILHTALQVLGQSREAGHRLDAVRLMILALGDWNLAKPSLEVFAGYESVHHLDPADPVAPRLRRALLELFPSEDGPLNLEAARLLAMLEAAEPALNTKLLARLTERSAPGDDFHYLAVLARARAPLASHDLPALARAIVGLDRKLDGLTQRPKQNWSIRLGEIVQALAAREPRLAEALLREPQLTRPGNVPLVLAAGLGRSTACARLFLAAVRREPNYAWSTPLVDLLSTLPGEETQPLFRLQWTRNLGLRERLVLELAQKADAADRDKFLAGLASADLRAVQACATALLALPRDPSGRALAPAFRQFRSVLDQPREQALRIRLVELLAHESGQILKQPAAAGDLRRTAQPILDWFTSRYPALAREADADDREDPARWNAFYTTVPWAQGQADRGEVLFQERGCATCHSGPRPIGPELSGVASRFSPADLFNTILFPSRDIAPAYRTLTFRTRDGGVYTGLVAFESADGVILQVNATETVRLAEADIISRVPSTGLLEGLTAAQFADLHAFLKSGRAGR
jgi:putative heme-binding domain-containing protein